MCSGVEQLVNIIKTYNLPCHLQGQTHRAGGSNGSKQRAPHPLMGGWGSTVQLEPSPEIKKPITHYYQLLNFSQNKVHHF